MDNKPPGSVHEAGRSSLSGAGLWLAAFLLTYNNVVNLLPASLHDRIYVWLNLGVLGLVWLWSRHYLRLNRAELGYAREGFGRSLLLGLLVALTVVLGFLILLRLFPMLGLNARAPSLDEAARQTVWWRILVRIPLGTAFFEETLFRGILYGHLIRTMPPRKTLWLSSILFAAWHLIPALKTMGHNLHPESALSFLTLWIGGLVGGFAGGLLFAWIRHKTRNTAGCVLAHVLINDVVLLIVSRSSGV